MRRPAFGALASLRSAAAALVLLGASFALVAAPALAAGPKAPAKGPPPGAPEHLAVARVEVLFRRDAALVTTELTFARSPAYRGAELAAFVAYGAPGLPRAFEARLLPVERGRFSPSDGEAGEALTGTHATHAPDGVALSLGGPNRAGQALRLPAASLQRAFEPSGLAALRLRAVHLLREGSTRASLVVRLGAPPGASPYPLGEISLRGDGVALRNPSAALCRPAGADLVLALSGAPPPPGALAAPRAPRLAGDELCVSAEFGP
ncbi:MAG: hypothetical protein MUF34_08975 [Polyangiaceae bacterium]|jgi:hypothetical protein|nr:hypothetical protein [Polyangiaceae bacterium]